MYSQQTFFKIVILFYTLVGCRSGLGQNISDSLLNSIEKSYGDDSALYSAYAQLVVNSIYYDLQGGQKHLDSQLHYAQKINSPYFISTTRAYAGIYHRFIGNYSESINQSKQALLILEEHQNDAALGMSLFNLGVVMDYQGKYEESIHYFLDYLRLNEKNEKWNNVGQAYNSISILYEELGDTEQSLQNLYKSLEIFKQYGSENDIGLAMGNLAGRYMDIEQWDSTFHYAHATLEIGERYDLDRTIGFACYVLAECHQRKQEYADALPYAERARDIYLRYPDKQLSFHNYISLSTIQRELGLAQQSYQNLITAQAIADSLDFLDGQKTVNNYLAQYHEQAGNYRSALTYHKKYKAIQDSIVNEKNTEIINELNIQYETAKKDAEINSQELEITKKTGQRNRLFFGLGILGLFSILMITRFKLRQRLTDEKLANLKQQQKLMAANYMVQGQEEERKRIAKDLHDGLGGLLATARLQLQNLQKSLQSSDDKQLTQTTENLLNNAYTEVRRISHDMMPNALINLGYIAAVEDLANQINLGGTIRIETHMHAEEALIAEKDKLNLYRITQEILNNVIKHAKADQVHIQFSETDTIYHLTIEDDGIGFDKNKMNSKNGLGLESIASRIEFINAEWDLHSSPGEGTSYEIRIPKYPS